jgi:CBS domain-containing protein
MMEPAVKDVMTTTVVAVKQGASYKEMAALLRKYRVSAFPVLDDDQKVIGIVSEADLLAKAALNADRGEAITAMVHHKELKKADGVTAGDLMSSNVVTVKPDDTVEQAARLMYHLQVGRNLMNRIRHVAGVVAVRDELSWPLPERSIAGVYF